MPEGDTLYHLSADSGDVWLRGPGGYSWIYEIYKDVVFGKTETIKVIRSGPMHPDSGGNEFYFTEQHLSSGFGIIYHWEEPYDELFLKGCIINGDTLGVLTSVEDIIYDFPESFVLNQNYPNPFNPNTQIIYQLPKNEFVTLKIFDILGKEIATLVNEEKLSGTYSINFNAKDLSSGIYFYSIRARNFFQVRKMILAK